MKLKIYTVLFSVIFAVAACGGGAQDGPPDPAMTKNMLKLRGYEFNEDGFFNAVKQNDVIAVKGFFDAGMNPNAKNRIGETALTYAVINSELKTVKAVAERADVNMQDGFGQSPLHLALSNKKDDVFNFLLDEKKADVNVGGSKQKLKNQTVLYLAVTRNQQDLIQKLFERGADPNVADSEGGVPLAEAVIGAAVNPEIVKMLIEKGANVNHQENNGATPLIYVASNNQTSPEKRQSVVKMLLDAGADAKLKDKKGNTALDWAKKSGNKDLIDLLK